MFKDPVFLSLFLLVFAVLWVLVCGLLSWLAGWYAFASQHPFPSDMQPYQSYNHGSIQFNRIGSYSYSMNIHFFEDGIGIEPLLLFKVFHPPIFIPWNKIKEIREEREFFWYPVLDMYIEKTRIRFYGKEVIGQIRQCYHNPESSYE